MNIITKNPIIVDNEKVSPRDQYANANGDAIIDFEYLPEEMIDADNLKIQTKYPVVLNGSDISPRDYYSNYTGVPAIDQKTLDQLAKAEEIAKKTGSSPSTSDKSSAKDKGLFWDSVKKSWQAFSTSDAGKMALAQLDAAITARRDARYGTAYAGSGAPVDGSMPPAPKDEPMSTTTKVLLIGGGVLVAGLIFYSMVSKGAQSK